MRKTPRYWARRWLHRCWCCGKPGDRYGDKHYWCPPCKFGVCEGACDLP